MLDYVKIIAEDKDLIVYRPSWNKFTSSVAATIWLSQVVYWWHKNDRKPFYKFNAPCDHENYREGDSWAEELGFSRADFDSARANIAEKTKGGDIKSGDIPNSLVYYWMDGYRRTWYALNEELFNQKISSHYLMPTIVGSYGGLSTSSGTETTQRLSSNKPIAESNKETIGFEPIEEDLLTKPYTELEEMCKQLKDKGYIVVVNYWWQLTGKQVPQLQKGGGKTSFATKFAKDYKRFIKDNPRFLKEIWSVLREFHFNVLPIKPESRKKWLNIEFILGPGKPDKGPGWLRLADKEPFFYFPENGVPNKPDVQPIYWSP